MGRWEIGKSFVSEKENGNKRQKLRSPDEAVPG